MAAPNPLLADKKTSAAASAPKSLSDIPPLDKKQTSENHWTHSVVTDASVWLFDLENVSEAEKRPLLQIMSLGLYRIIKFTPAARPIIGEILIHPFIHIPFKIKIDTFKGSKNIIIYCVDDASAKTLKGQISSNSYVKQRGNYVHFVTQKAFAFNPAVPFNKYYYQEMLNLFNYLEKDNRIANPIVREEMLKWLHPCEYVKQCLSKDITTVSAYVQDMHDEILYAAYFNAVAELRNYDPKLFGEIYNVYLKLLGSHLESVHHNILRANWPDEAFNSCVRIIKFSVDKDDLTYQPLLPRWVNDLKDEISYLQPSPKQWEDYIKFLGSGSSADAPNPSTLADPKHFTYKQCAQYLAYSLMLAKLYGAQGYFNEAIKTYSLLRDLLSKDEILKKSVLYRDCMEKISMYTTFQDMKDTNRKVNAQLEKLRQENELLRAKLATQAKSRGDLTSPSTNATTMTASTHQPLSAAPEATAAPNLPTKAAPTTSVLTQFSTSCTKPTQSNPATATASAAAGVHTTTVTPTPGTAAINSSPS